MKITEENKHKIILIKKDEKNVKVVQINLFLGPEPYSPGPYCCRIIKK